LVALDVGLDTGAAAGRQTVAVLREIERLMRAGEPGRPPRGRPGIAIRAPELSERITAMRERGLSLQAIADTLNAEGVSTQRGGARWRPSRCPARVEPAVPPHPPDTDAKIALARFRSPPLTAAYVPVALFSWPPLTDAPKLVVTLFTPPVIDSSPSSHGPGGAAWFPPFWRSRRIPRPRGSLGRYSTGRH